MVSRYCGWHFPLCTSNHIYSGVAGLTSPFPRPPTRPAGEELIGARAYRVVFALVSLPLALAAVVYFIDHRYDGAALWNLRWVR